MAILIPSPTRIEAPGYPPKTIEEYIGRVNSGTKDVSIARMVSPCGWSEPAQTPEFDEYTVVLRGQLRVETRETAYDVTTGQAIIVPRSVCRHFLRTQCTAKTRWGPEPTSETNPGQMYLRRQSPS
jgi:hypothetical protein